MPIKQATPSKSPSNPNAEVSFSSPRITDCELLNGGKQFFSLKMPSPLFKYAPVPRPQSQKYLESF